ncbi:MAG: hypothetical protein NTY77_09455 [Elusimicrobia bacterium]|nr:hypothetical protein [Elusimicrobiota bacterium]
MGQETDLPKINPEVNREEKKRSGLAALLFRLGIGTEAGGGAAGLGAVGGGGAGGLGGLLGAGISGGLLATKAGIIGLILVGTTVAGSLGVVAYKLFGPTAADRSDASFTSLFAPKPQNQAGAGGQDSSASANGASKSLQFLVDANSKGQAAPQEQAAPEAAAAPAAPSASAAAVPPPLRNDNVGGSTIAKLKMDHKIGDLTKGATSGSGGSVSLPAAGGPAGNASLLAKANRGNLGANTASHGASGLQALRSGRALGSSGVVRQLSAVHHDQKGATSSMGAGRTYDGNTAQAASPSAESPSAAQEGAHDRNPSVNPSGGGSPDSQFGSSVPAVTGKNVTPWQAAINTAMMLVMASAMILFMASKIGSMQGLSLGLAKAIIILLAIIAAALAAKVVSLGAEIGGGKFGQQLQGQMLALAGGCLIATSAVLIVSAAGAKAEGDPVKAGDPIKGSDPAANYDAAGATKANATADDKALATAMGGNTHLLMMVCGGAALAATAWAYMAPKKSYEASLFKDGRPPDWDHPYQSSQVVRPPSQGILDRYLV